MKDINKWKDISIHVHGSEDLIPLRLHYPKQSADSNAFPIKTPMAFLAEIGKPILKPLESQGTLESHLDLEKEQSGKIHTLSDFKTYCEATVSQNGEGAESTRWGKGSFFQKIMLGKLDIHTQKTEAGS